MGSADDRRFEVLRAIVADFVSTKEPIGSKTLVERHNLGVSSATGFGARCASRSGGRCCVIVYYRSWGNQRMS